MSRPIDTCFEAQFNRYFGNYSELQEYLPPEVFSDYSTPPLMPAIQEEPDIEVEYQENTGKS